MGPTRWTLPVVFFVLARSSRSHITSAMLACVVGFRRHGVHCRGTLNQNTFLASTRSRTNLAFKSFRANKCLRNPVEPGHRRAVCHGVQGYHIEHHKFLGEDGFDTDLPSRIEAVLLNNVAGKTFFA